jgi:hypothetical protein
VKTCPHCNRENDQAAGKCKYCGAELEAFENVILPETQNLLKSGEKPPSIRAKFYYWLAAVAGLVLIVLLINPGYLRNAFFFPVGLFALFPGGDGTGIKASMLAMKGDFFIVGWLLYAALTAIIFTAKKRRAFVFRYAIFCVLLLLNVGGCHHVWESLSGIQ